MEDIFMTKLFVSVNFYLFIFVSLPPSLPQVIGDNRSENQ